MPTEPTENDPRYGHRVDDDRDFDIGFADVVLGVLTLPLLFWFLMYVVTGGERFVATPQARMRVYAWLLAIEVVLGGAIVAWLVLR
ncbi:MAG: hypothetical protein JWM98_2737 [Thermoleophilia bacterium]|nr:hypothetical protein [Thermoleophilia bacterium]